MTGAERTEGKLAVEYPVVKKWPFEIPPPPIPQKEIKEVITADVIVVGAGLSGACAALSAAQAGARTIVIEKGPTFMSHGVAYGSVGSRMQKLAGIEIDRDEIIAEIMRWGSYRADQRLVSLWADKSGQVMDWLLDMTDAAGITATLTPCKSVEMRYYRGYPIGHRFPPLTVMPMLEAKMRESGVDIRYEAPAVRLLRVGKGRVTGVIAQTSDSYKQFNARAVVLCTGGYENNREMVGKYMPRVLNAMRCCYYPPLTTGDGHKMGLWIGAAMDEEPHCSNIFDGGNPDLAGPIDVVIALPRQPWLNVNILGERYVNEDLPFGYTSNADLSQPDHVKWSVWDDKWEEEAPRFGSIACRSMAGPPFHIPEIVQEKIDKGFILKADTLEELARKMDVPYETFRATVERYNDLARMGKDLDFGKDPSKLTTIEKPPFYAAKLGVDLLVTLSGLKVNTKLQVLGTDGNVIPGLYAAGNVSGGFFANDYPITVGPISHGRALTFGRLAGLNAAVE